MKKILILIVIPIIVLSAYKAFAYQVIKVKNKKLLISFSSQEDLQVKDSFYVINKRGKKKAIISILKVKGNKAIAEVLKGKAQAGWSLKLRKRALKPKPKVVKSYVPKQRASHTNYAKKLNKRSTKLFNHLSFLWGTSFNGLEIGATDHKGTSFFNFETSTTFFLPNKPIFGLRILSSSENFTLDGSCSNNAAEQADCKTNIVYLGGGALTIAHIPVSREISVWGGVGIKLLIPIKKTVTNLGPEYDYINVESIKATSGLLLSGGVKFKFNPRFSIPLNVNYTIFPSSDAIKAHSAFNVQTGLVYHF